MLEKILVSPLDCKEIQPVHSKGDQSWVFIARTDTKAETPILWLHDVKTTGWNTQRGSLSTKRREEGKRRDDQEKRGSQKERDRSSQ